MTDAAPVRAVEGFGPQFFERARARLTLDVPAALSDLAASAMRGDLDLDPEAWKRAGVAAVKPAAVLVAVVDRAAPSVILTLRTAGLPTHAGQIAFAGGTIDPGDASPAEAAMREAHEEIGLERSFVEPIGYLDLYLTFSGFRILPTVARVDPDYALSLNRAEVSDAFEVPLEFLMQPDNHQRRSRDWNGITRHYYAMPYRDHYIWGATAGILRNLYEQLYRE
jgi:8-oxo-dGTP pyrophosphatase MutT (NUDIX family)